MVELKDMIRNTRKMQKLTQEQFAHMIGATTNSVCSWERGKATPRIKFLKKMGLYSTTQTAKEIGAKRLLDALGINLPPRRKSLNAAPKNSEFVSVNSDGSAYVRKDSVLCVSSFQRGPEHNGKCMGDWGFSVMYGRLGDMRITYNNDHYPDEEQAIAALHDFMERLTEK